MEPLDWFLIAAMVMLVALAGDQLSRSTWVRDEHGPKHPMHHMIVTMITLCGVLGWPIVYNAVVGYEHATDSGGMNAIGLFLPMIIGTLNLLSAGNVSTYTRDSGPVNLLPNIINETARTFLGNAFAVSAILAVLANKSVLGRRYILYGFILCLACVVPDFAFRERSVAQTVQIATQQTLLTWAFGLMLVGITVDLNAPPPSGS